MTKPLPPDSPGGVRWSVVSALGITQTLSWASTFYLPAVFAGPVSDDLAIPVNGFYAMFSGALLLSGLLGPLAGRVIDRHGGRDVLVVTNLAIAGGLVLLALAQGWVGLAAAWLLLGIGMGFGLYEAAFTTVTGLYGRAARNAITGITLFAGFASTVGWPLSALFIDAFGWRGACLAWACLHLLLGLPLNRLVVARAPAPTLPIAQPSAEGKPSGAPWIMILLAGVFGVAWFVSTAWAAHLPRLLEALGATPAIAVLAAAFMGPAQVVARVFEFTVLRQFSPLLSARLAASLHPLGAVLLLLLGAPMAIPFVLLHGGGNGIMTIARGTLPLALFGPAGYGLRTGLLAAPARILQAVAPVLFAVIIERAGPQAAVVLSGCLMALAAATLLLLRSPQAQ